MADQTLNIGMMGLSSGNGHPYSWSAIFNGYDPAAMAGSGFPNIAAYLARQKFPDDCISNGRVTHIWTQDESLSRQIARTCRIPHVAGNYEEFIGTVDAVILARDDHENHFQMAKPLIESGLPVFIDKPLAVSLAEAERILVLEKYPGQVFTCSALRYAREFYLTAEERQAVGALTRIEGRTVKSWDKYAVHVIEPAVSLMEPQDRPARMRRTREGEAVTVEAVWESGLEMSFTALGPDVKQGGISLTYIGKNGSVIKQFENSFTAFKTALVNFVEAARTRRLIIPRHETFRTAQIIEAGLGHDAR